MTMDRIVAYINMDMVGEGLRKNNAALRMSECPGHLPSYLDGLARSLAPDSGAPAARQPRKSSRAAQTRSGAPSR